MSSPFWPLQPLPLFSLEHNSTQSSKEILRSTFLPSVCPAAFGPLEVRPRRKIRNFIRFWTNSTVLDNSRSGTNEAPTFCGALPIIAPNHSSRSPVCRTAAVSSSRARTSSPAPPAVPRRAFPGPAGVGCGHPARQAVFPCAHGIIRNGLGRITCARSHGAMVHSIPCAHDYACP